VSEQDELNDANAALALLSDPIFLKAVEQVKTDVTAEWIRGKDQRAREDAHAELRAVAKVVDRLESYRMNGDIIVVRQKRAEQLKNQR
jgi:hypothetical protein